MDPNAPASEAGAGLPASTDGSWQRRNRPLRDSHSKGHRVPSAAESSTLDPSPGVPTGPHIHLTGVPHPLLHPPWFLHS